MIIDPEELDQTAAYKLLIGSVIPRPIAWVSTLSETSVANLAPISFFTVVSRKPPRISLTMQPRSDGVTLKDSFVNIRDTGEFVTHMATFPQLDAVHGTAVEFEPDVDEYEAVGLEKEPSDAVRPPRIKGAPIAMECVVDRIFSSPDGLGHVVWGKIVRFYIRDDLYLPNGRIDTGGVLALGRLAAEYTVVNNAFAPPLSQDVIAAYTGRRVARLDAEAEHYSPVDTAAWSPSGATTERSEAALTSARSC
jgi:flavin reductase (DIM6/NTAB) family NADH-FMN oxidoreductase RutF